MMTKDEPEIGDVDSEVWKTAYTGLSATLQMEFQRWFGMKWVLLCKSETVTLIGGGMMIDDDKSEMLNLSQFQKPLIPQYLR